MRTYTTTVREGEDVGPVDWDHPIAKDMPPIWREAEKSPGDFILSGDYFKPPQVIKLCMYDGWPYWKPTPAILHTSPLGGSEWSFFNDYGVRPNSIQRKREPSHD